MAWEVTVGQCPHIRDIGSTMRQGPNISMSSRNKQRGAEDTPNDTTS